MDISSKLVAGTIGLAVNEFLEDSYTDKHPVPLVLYINTR